MKWEVIKDKLIDAVVTIAVWAGMTTASFFIAVWTKNTWLFLITWPIFILFLTIPFMLFKREYVRMIGRWLRDAEK